MSWLRSIEILVGLYYLVFGVDGFLKKIPLPPPSGPALRFLIALEEAVYVMPTVKIIEIGVGLAWILGVKTGLAWVIFTPVLVNILAFHWFLNRRERLMPLVWLGAHLLLAFKNQDYLQSLLTL